MPNNKATVSYTPFFQPKNLPTAKYVDHVFADKMDRLRELIYKAEGIETTDLSAVRLRTGARAGSLQVMSQRQAA